jgi:hypothetical protein
MIFCLSVSCNALNHSLNWLLHRRASVSPVQCFWLFHRALKNILLPVNWVISPNPKVRVFSMHLFWQCLLCSHHRDPHPYHAAKDPYKVQLFYWINASVFDGPVFNWGL